MINIHNPLNTFCLMSIPSSEYAKTLSKIISLIESSNFQAAINLCRSLDQDHKTADIYILEGLCEVKAGDSKQAEQCFQQAITVDKNHTDAHAALGALLTKSDPAQAVSHYLKSLELSPQNIAHYLSLGDIYTSLGNIQNAEQVYAQAISLDKTCADGYIKLGDIFLLQGKIDAANALFRIANTLAPNRPEPIIRMAQALERKKEYKEAWRLLKPLTSDPKNIHIDAINIYLLISRHIGEEKHAIELADQALSNKKLSPSAQRLLHANLGQLLDKIGEYDRAFSHFQQLERFISKHYNAEEESNKTTQTINAFPKGFEDLIAHSNNENKQLVFIVGMPRSGTSLVDQIISSHPNVEALGETNIISSLHSKVIEDIKPKDNPFISELYSTSYVDGLKELFLNHCQTINPNISQAERVTEKTPFNFQHLGFISTLFPNSRIIHIKRDPLDTCLSCYTHNFSDVLSFTFNLKHLGHYYNEYQKYIKHWKAVLPLPMLELKYEEITDDPEDEIRKIIDFCGLEWNEECLRFYDSKRFVPTASYDQVRQPLYKNSVGRWRNYEKHLQPLIKTLETPN